MAYLAIPDKRFTFDAERPITPFEHLLRDHHQGPAWSRRQHFEEWVRYKEQREGDEAIARIEELMAMGYTGTHYHVWSQAELLEFFASLQKQRGFAFDVELVGKNDVEVIFVLRKHGE